MKWIIDEHSISIRRYKDMAYTDKLCFVIAPKGEQMKLEVGNFYLTAGREIIEIEFFNGNMFEDINQNTYFENGKCDGDCREFDLIAHIPKELHWSLVNQVYSYYKNINARNKIVRRHKNFFNKKKIIIPS